MVALTALLGVGLSACATDTPPSTPTTTVPVDPADPELISVGQAPEPENAVISDAAMSDDGNIIAFVSVARYVLGDPTNDTANLYVRDRSEGTTVRIAEAVRNLSQVTPNGRFVSYSHHVDDEKAFSVYDVATGSTSTWTPTWEASANDLLAVDPSGAAVVYGAHRGLSLIGTSHGFVRNLVDGSQANCPVRGSGTGTTGLMAVSANARYVLYTWTDESDYDQNGMVLWDRQKNTKTRVSPAIMALFSDATFTLSDDGKFVVGMGLGVVTVDGETKNALVIHHVNLKNGATKVLDYAQVLGGTMDGGVTPQAISPDGKRVVLQSYKHAFDPTREGIWSDVYIWDIATNTVKRLATDLPSGTSNASTLACAGASTLANNSGMCVIVAGTMGESPQPTTSDAWLVGMP